MAILDATGSSHGASVISATTTATIRSSALIRPACMLSANVNKIQKSNSSLSSGAGVASDSIYVHNTAPSVELTSEATALAKHLLYTTGDSYGVVSFSGAPVFTQYPTTLVDDKGNTQPTPVNIGMSYEVVYLEATLPLIKGQSGVLATVLHLYAPKGIINSVAVLNGSSITVVNPSGTSNGKTSIVTKAYQIYYMSGSTDPVSSVTSSDPKTILNTAGSIELYAVVTADTLSTIGIRGAASNVASVEATVYKSLSTPAVSTGSSVVSADARIVQDVSLIINATSGVVSSATKISSSQAVLDIMSSVSANVNLVKVSASLVGIGGSVSGTPIMISRNPVRINATSVVQSGPALIRKTSGTINGIATIRVSEIAEVITEVNLVGTILPVNLVGTHSMAVDLVGTVQPNVNLRGELIDK